MVGTIDQCLDDVFAESNTDLCEALNVNYNTIASWRHQHRLGLLSVEKKKQILSLKGYKLKKEELWSKRKGK